MCCCFTGIPLSPAKTLLSQKELRDVMYLVMNTPHWKTIWGLQLSFYITAQTATGSFESVSIIIELFPFFKVFTERLQNKNPNSTTVPHTLEQQGRPIRL